MRCKKIFLWITSGFLHTIPSLLLNISILIFYRTVRYHTCVFDSPPNHNPGFEGNAFLDSFHPLHFLLSDPHPLFNVFLLFFHQSLCHFPQSWSTYCLWLNVDGYKVGRYVAATSPSPSPSPSPRSVCSSVRRKRFIFSQQLILFIRYCFISRPQAWPRHRVLKLWTGRSSRSWLQNQRHFRHHKMPKNNCARRENRRRQVSIYLSI